MLEWIFVFSLTFSSPEDVPVYGKRVELEVRAESLEKCQNARTTVMKKLLLFPVELGECRRRGRALEVQEP